MDSRESLSQRLIELMVVDHKRPHGMPVDVRKLHQDRAKFVRSLGADPDAEAARIERNRVIGTEMISTEGREKWTEPRRSYWPRSRLESAFGNFRVGNRA